MFGMRRWLPLPGVAGGLPGSCNQFLIHRADGTVEQTAANTSGVELGPADSFELRLPSGGGYGDPLDRDADAVARDVATGRFDAADALAIYGVVLDPARRGRRAHDPFARATPRARDRLDPRNPRRARSNPSGPMIAPNGSELPLLRSSPVSCSAATSPTRRRAPRRSRSRPTTSRTGARSWSAAALRGSSDRDARVPRPRFGAALHVEVGLAGRPAHLRDRATAVGADRVS